MPSPGKNGKPFGRKFLGNRSANEIAEEYGISTTLMAKVLQKLARNTLVAAKHGSTGGYQLAFLAGALFAALAATLGGLLFRVARPAAAGAHGEGVGAPATAEAD